jgi:hypothetical protein
VTRRQWLGAAALAGPALRAQERPRPQALYEKILGNPNLKKFSRGEDFCWHAAYDLPRFVAGYRATKDTAWLDWGVRYYEFLVDRLDTGPDGYRGWIGPYEYDESVWCDVHVGDAILFDGLLGFSEVVLGDRALEARYGEPARRYVELARRNLFDKWDARGTWVIDGPFAAYRSWNRYGRPENFKDWPVRDEIKNSNLALPFNKQDDLASAALKLYRITGEAKFRERAFRIFAFQKSRLQLIDDHYCWNYWEPYGAADVDQAAGRTRHWVGVHPDRPYQAGEVAHMVDAYHTGVVFDEQDMRRIVNTNLRVMWNGSFDAPHFRNSNGRTDQKAGTLWTALADFDEAARKLARRDEAAAGFERRRLKGPVEVFEWPFTSCPEINMAAALDGGALLACNAAVRGKIEIAQYSVDGARKLAVLHEVERAGQVFHKWSRPQARCRVRFTFDGGPHRDVLVG